MIPMEIHRKALKDRARQTMRQNVPPAWLVALLFWGLTTGVSTISDLAGFTTSLAATSSGVQFFPLFFTLLLTLYSVVMNFGYEIWCLRAWRRDEADFATLIDGFGMAGQVLLMEIQIFLRLFGWCLLPVIPATVIISAANSLEMMILLTQLFTFALIPYLYFIRLRYALAPYLLMDRPDRGAAAAVRESVGLMRGWKMELFKLDLSFLGWYLLEWGLAILAQVIFLIPTLIGIFQSGATPETLMTLVAGTTAGSLVGLLLCLPVELWLLPYTGLSRAGFYDARISFVPPAPLVYTYDSTR